MSQLPELTDDATIVVTQEGGFAFIPGLRNERRFPLGELPPPEKAHVCQVLERAMPLGELKEKAAEVGRGINVTSASRFNMPRASSPARSSYWFPSNRRRQNSSRCCATVSNKAAFSEGGFRIALRRLMNP